jgi:hypothetical protein
MRSGDTRRRRSDPLLKRFIDGLRNWENPFHRRVPSLTRGVRATRVRTRGAVSTPSVGADPLEEDTVLREFTGGLERWERPFDKR